jgi:hypothetical protein
MTPRTLSYYLIVIHRTRCYRRPATWRRGVTRFTYICGGYVINAFASGNSAIVTRDAGIRDRTMIHCCPLPAKGVMTSIAFRCRRYMISGFNGRNVGTKSMAVTAHTRQYISMNSRWTVQVIPCGWRCLMTGITRVGRSWVRK